MTTPPHGEAAHARSEELLRQAAQTSNMAERGRLIDEAAWWRFRAADTGASALAFDLEDPPEQLVAALKRV